MSEYERMGIFAFVLFPLAGASILYVTVRMFYHLTYRVEVEQERVVHESHVTHSVEVIHTTEPLEVAVPIQEPFTPDEPLQVAEFLRDSNRSSGHSLEI